MSDILASAMAAVDGDSMPLSSSVVVLVSGAATVLLASALAYVLWMTNKTKQHVAASASAANTAAATSTITIDKTQYPGGEISVYYATQTGTAESFARTLEREGAQYGFYVHVVDLEDVSVEDLLLVQKQKQQQQQHKDDTDNNNNDASSTTSRVIVLAATYGEGEAPDNATSFARALCEKGNTQLLWERHKDNNDTTNSIPEPVCLQGVDYCVFGLGNKQYDHYNAMGKFFDHALERVGANRILPLGMGDDDDDLENDFETWKDTQLWPTFQKLYNVSQTNVVAVSQQQQQQQQQQKLPECQYVIEYHNNNNNNKPRKLSMDQVHGSSRHYFTAVQCPVKVVRELRSGNLEAGSTVHMEVDISKHKKQLNYHTADNLGVIPVNNNRVVESVAQSLQFHHHHHNKNDNIDLEQLFSLQAAPNHEWHGAPFPMPISVRDCLAQYCDLTSPPRRSDLKLLAAYATDPTDQKFLLRLASKEGRAEYREKILEQYTGLVQLLQKCPSIQMPLEHFLNLVPLQQTRFYTGSSSSSVHTNTIHLTVAVTQIPRPDGTMFKGVCSTYLANIMQTNSNGEANNKKQQQQQMIRVYNRPSTFRLPSDPSTPILMIGPGTGIAPMRALLQERAYQRTKLKLPVGSNILYFGCKKEAHDYLYREELEAWVRDGTLTTLRLAFSRDSPDKKKKVYVQHLLAQDGDTLYKLIEDQGAFIYVCGGVKMGQDVAETLNQIIASHGNLSSHDQAKEYLDKLSASGRFVQELWA